MPSSTENNFECLKKGGNHRNGEWLSNHLNQQRTSVHMQTNVGSPSHGLQESPSADNRDRDRLHTVWKLVHREGTMLDEQLVQQLQHGQREAFTTLVSKWQDRIYTFCLRQLGECELAEEATQDIFVKVFTSIQNFRMESKFSTWLYRIATNHCINLRTKHHRRHRNQHQSFDEMDNQLHTVDNPIDRLETLDLEQQLQEALRGLPEEHRALLILRDIQDCSYEEIAEITSLNLGTIKSRIHRGRKQLKIVLEGGHNE